MNSPINGIINKKLFLAIRSFRDPADEDYCVARWSYFESKERTFFWYAQQCIEKYLKCALLLNGESIQIYKRHDTKPLLERAFDLFGSIIPGEITPPPTFPSYEDPRLGFGETISIVEKYAQNGDPSNRYGLFYTDWNNIGLHSFDELIFALRRVCGVLDQTDSQGKKLRETLIADSRYQIPAKKEFSSGYVTRMNFSFFPEAAIEDGKTTRILMPGFTNSPFYLLVQENSDDARSAIRWFLDNAVVPRDARHELEAHLSKNVSRPP